MIAPIALFVYKRPEHTRRCLESLMANPLAKQSDLYIFCDAAKTPADHSMVQQTREVVRQVSGFNRIEVVERVTNWGLAASIIAGVTQLCHQFSKVIVIEDDLILSPYFLQYMNSALEYYANETKVGCIHGYVYPTQKPLPQTFFLRGGDCWGWATWQRAWQYFEPCGQKLLQNIVLQNEVAGFTLNRANDNLQMLKDQIAGRNNSWAIRWHASLYLRNMLTLYPGQSLVNNIGLDDTGTHCNATNVYQVDLAHNAAVIQSIPLVQNTMACKAFESFYRSLKPSFAQRVWRKLNTMLSKTDEKVS